MLIPLPIISYAFGLAANDPGCAQGPLQLQADNLQKEWLQRGLKIHWQQTLRSHALHQSVLKQVVTLNSQLAPLTYHFAKNQQLFLVLGGDHSCAIGTWSGVAAHFQEKKADLGLIWIDAHMDSHTFATTASGNIHGMPLAALLGYGDPQLTQILSIQPKLKPEYISLIGVRSFEGEEAALLHQLGVRLYDMLEIGTRGLAAVLEEAIERAREGTAGFGVSLDLDAIDPRDAPGVGVPEKNGLNGIELSQALRRLRQEKQFVGMEIVEFNPFRDKEHKTVQLIFDLILNSFGDTHV